MIEEISILKALLDNRHRDLNIRQISKLAKKDYKNTYDVISRLEKAGIVKLERFGRSSKISLINQSHPLIFEAEYARRAELVKSKSIAVMLDYFSRLSSKFFILLVFGSYAKKKNTKSSDIDLMFIVPDMCEDKLDKEISNIASLIPLKIHVNVFKEKDFIAMKESKKVTVGSEAMKHNVILEGIEDYYRLIR